MKVFELLFLFGFGAVCASPVFSPAKKQSNPICEICKSFVSAANKFIAQEQVKKSVVDFVKISCESYDVKESLKTECKEVVDGYFRAFLNNVGKTLNPDLDCAIMKFCPFKMASSDLSDETEQFSSYEESQKLDSEEEDDESKEINFAGFDRRSHRHPHRHHRHHHHHHPNDSSLCAVSMVGVQDKMNQNDFDKSVINAIGLMCSSLPVGSELCKQFVTGHLTDAMDYVKSSEIEDICNTLHHHLEYFNDAASIQSLKVKIVVEGSRAFNQITPAEMGESDGFMCTVCETFYDTLKDNMKKYKTMAEKLCTYVPKTFTETCSQTVDVLFDDIIKVLAKTEAKTVCSKCGLCAEEFDLQAIVTFIMDNIEDFEDIFEKLKPVLATLGDVALEKLL